MHISVTLKLEVGGVAGMGWFDMAVATGNEGSFCDRRGQVLGMLDQHRRTPFFLLLGRAILTKRPTSFQ